MVKNKVVMMDTWKLYFEKLSCNAEFDNQEHLTDKNIKRRVETKIEIERTENVKPSDHGQMPGDMLKNFGRKGLYVLFKVFNDAMNVNVITEDWEIRIIFPIFKEGYETQ